MTRHPGLSGEHLRAAGEARAAARLAQETWHATAAKVTAEAALAAARMIATLAVRPGLARTRTPNSVPREPGWPSPGSAWPPTRRLSGADRAVRAVVTAAGMPGADAANLSGAWSAGTGFPAHCAAPMPLARAGPPEVSMTGRPADLRRRAECGRRVRASGSCEGFRGDVGVTLSARCLRRRTLVSARTSKLVQVLLSTT